MEEDTSRMHEEAESITDVIVAIIGYYRCDSVANRARITEALQRMATLLGDAP